MDGVLVDFISGALEVFNKVLGRDYTVEDYADNFGKFGIHIFYGISNKEFWQILKEEKDFWLNLKPYPWTTELYKDLSEYGNITIVTTPSEIDYTCATQKLAWLNKYLSISSKDVFIGSKKYLMAGNGILIDDFEKNINDFRIAGGDAICIPANWNMSFIDYETLKSLTFPTLEKIISWRKER